MNIFFLSANAYECAEQHCDKHVVKMILETAQLLSTAHHVLDGEKAIGGIYKATHVNHPSAIWVRQSDMNYAWTYSLFEALCEEYTYRYGKIHKTDANMRELLRALPYSIEYDIWTAPPQCMPDEFKHADTVTAYRNYYIGAKAPICRWTKRAPPDWWPLS